MQIKTPIERRQHCVQGQVQGVGFRPFVFRLAHKYGLSGFVHNTPEGVFIEVQGLVDNLNAFQETFSKELPPLARVFSHSIISIPVQLDTQKNIRTYETKSNHTSSVMDIYDVACGNTSSFYIKHTKEGEHEGHTVLISPDSAICLDCQQDIQDQKSPHYAYAFTNCTNCGPRYTITKSIPYDRISTSMACFPMCPTCQEEYDNPLDRRFHAQPNACEKCGPRLWLKKNTKLIQYKKNSAQLRINTDIHKGLLTQCHLKKRIRESLSCATFFPSRGFFLSTSIVIAQTQKKLQYGNIVAIKSLGGFQLACDAYNKEAIEVLRQRKNRPHKAFAIMVASLEHAKEIAHITKEAEALLSSTEAPIVLCRKKRNSLTNIHNINDNNNRIVTKQLPHNIAPDTNRIGIMLPYTPLHKLLFQKQKNGKQLQALIMTSANTSGEPICIKNRQALQALTHITDYYLFHNRDILVRVDDSVCLALKEQQPEENNVQEQGIPYGTNNNSKSIRFLKGVTPFSGEFERQSLSSQSHALNKHIMPSTLFFRRARGYVPSPSLLPKIGERKEKNIPSVFASGAFLKNTFCLTRQNDAFVSQHIGDLDNLAVMEFYEETFAHLQKLLEVQNIQTVVCDAHPDFPSTHFAKKIAEQYNASLFTLQHHAAHAYAVLAEQEEYDLSAVLALVLDGTGYGLDGTTWGGEFLYIAPSRSNDSIGENCQKTYQHNTQNAFQNKCSQESMLRLGRLTPISLIGGETAIQEPWRIAYGLYVECMEKAYITEKMCDRVDTHVLPWLSSLAYKNLTPMLKSMLEKNINCPKSSGCGRLFDAVSALLGLCLVSTYEGQAAIKLEAEQFNAETVDYGFDFFGGDNLPQPPIITHAEVFDYYFSGKKELPIKSPYTPIWEVDSHALFAQVYKEYCAQIPKYIIAQNFHKNLASSFALMAQEAKKKTGLNKIVLCGGVMNNETLLTALCNELHHAGFQLLLPKKMPSGDGAISLGQAFYGSLQNKSAFL